jgi:capsular polysaccharide biosynthesis protein
VSRRFETHEPAVRHDTPHADSHHQSGFGRRADEDITVWRTPDGGATTARGDAGSTDAEDLVEAPADETASWLAVAPGSQLVNLHFVLGALKRRRRWVIGFAIAGLALGVSLAVALAPPPRAATTVLLVHPAASDRAPAMVTDAQLLQTHGVARRVVDSLHLAETPAAFAATYQGTVLSDDLLSISVSASSGSEAIRRANALAREYLAYRAHVYESQSKALIAGLQAREAAIQQRIRDLDQQLGTRAGLITSDDPATAALLGQRANLGQDLTAIADGITAQTSSVTGVIDGSSAIDTATLVRRSRVAALGRDALSGLAAGLALGLAVVVLASVTSNRVWRRDDVAEAMRHSVDLSTGPVRVMPWARRHAAEQLAARPPPALAKLVVHLRDQLVATASTDRSLAVVAVGQLEVATAAVRATAAALDDDGERVVVEGNAAVPGAAHLRRDGDDFLLVVTAPDPADGAEALRALASGAVVIVTAGQSTMATLRTVADMLDVADVELRSVVLVGSSPHDDSLGRTREPRTQPDASGPSDASDPPDGAAPSLLIPSAGR